MSKTIRTKKLAALLLAICLCVTFGLAMSRSFAFAYTPTDEIINYDIQADVNDDATVSFVYTLDWEVLESDGIGPVEWLKIGIPNSHADNVRALTDNIYRLSLLQEDGTYMRVDFKDKYYEGETIHFSFAFDCDYMYQMNANEEGYTSYYFTPGWFNDVAIDRLVIRWNSDKLDSWSGSSLVKDGYNTWEYYMDPGDTVTLELVYKNDAFGFSADKNYSDGYDYGDYDYYESENDGLYMVIGAIASLLPPIFVIAVIAKVIKGMSEAAYDKGSGFANGETKTKVTHTKVIYYDSCPGCGAPRPDGETVCPYCGRDLVKSEELIKEEEVKGEDKDALKYKTKGEYHYGSDPNQYVRVNVVHVPVVAPSTRPSGRTGGRSGGSTFGSRSRGGGGHSCAHSSCACASCACACACACAGGGRAGCTTKDFYNTNLKLKQLEIKNKKRKIRS